MDFKFGFFFRVVAKVRMWYVVMDLASTPEKAEQHSARVGTYQGQSTSEIGLCAKTTCGF
jgi:hypothetical protein